MPVGSTDWIIPRGLSASPARLRVSQVRTALRSVAHAAMRPYRGGALCIPVCPSREHVGTRPRLRFPLWSVLPQAKRSRRSIRLRVPLPPLACSRRANLASKHTHMSMEAYPPDGPQISPRQGSQNFSARVWGFERVIFRTAVVFGVSAALGKLLRPASWRLRRP